MAAEAGCQELFLDMIITAGSHWKFIWEKKKKKDLNPHEKCPELWNYLGGFHRENKRYLNAARRETSQQQYQVFHWRIRAPGVTIKIRTLVSNVVPEIIWSYLEMSEASLRRGSSQREKKGGKPCFVNIALSCISLMMPAAHCRSHPLVIQRSNRWLFGCKVLGIETLPSSPLFSPEYYLVQGKYSSDPLPLAPLSISGFLAAFFFFFGPPLLSPTDLACSCCGPARVNRPSPRQ